MDLRSATADELKTLFQEFLNERARDMNLQIPEPELSGKDLHDRKNAPWADGIYSKLVFPKYEHREYPKMLYSRHYVPAVQKYEQIRRMRIRQDQQQDYVLWIEDAERDKREATKIVGSQRELERAYAEGWRESPDEAVEAQKALDDEIAAVAAHANYEDRNLSPAAKAEREAYDATLEEHLTEVPSAKERKRKKDETRETVGA